MNKHFLKTRQSSVASCDWVKQYENNYGETDSCLRSLAVLKAQQADYSEAVLLLSKLIDRHPHNAIDYNNRGLVYFQSGQLDEAIADYNRAIQLNPHLASAYNNRGNYYATCGHLAAAFADYDQAINLNPSYVRAWINRGITLRDMGQYEQAIENFDIVEGLKCGFLPKPSPEEALAAYSSPSPAAPKADVDLLQGHIYAERGRTYHLRGDWNCAIADYRRALKQLPQVSYSTEQASRLRRQVENWFNQLVSPLWD